MILIRYKLSVGRQILVYGAAVSVGPVIEICVAVGSTGVSSVGTTGVSSVTVG